MKRFLALLAIFSLIFCPLSFAAISDVTDNDTFVSRPRTLDAGTGLTATASAGKVTLAVSGAQSVTSVTASGDVTFRSTLITEGRYGNTVLELQSSSTAVGAAQLANAVITKRIGGAGGLDSDGIGTALANGTPGQVISFIIIYREGSGSWVVTPVTKTGFSKLTFDAVGEVATLLYVNDTVGWIVRSSTATVA